MTGSSHEVTLEATFSGAERASSVGEPFEGLVRGAEIGRYMIIEPVGFGAMGVVVAAYDPQLDRKVALKLIEPRGRDLSRSRARLQREAQALARLDHPNVVAVHDVGVHQEQLFVTMEFVEGQTLGAWMKSAPTASIVSGSRERGTGSGGPVQLRPWREVLEVFVQAGRGLAAAHEAGLVHRDFKPDNVMLSEDGRVRVMDFGLARADEDEQIDTVERRLSVDSLTQTGTLMGTPAYMSLEQFSTGQVDARSDQFSFCVALYEALYGERPFVGETVSELVFALQQGVVRERVRPGRVPGWVRAVVVRGLDKDPEARFESMKELLEALAADPSARRRRFAVRAGLGLVLAAGAWGIGSLKGKVVQRDQTISRQKSELADASVELADRLAVLRGLRAGSLVGAGHEAEALLLGVQAVGAYTGEWAKVPPEAIEGLEQVLARDPMIVQASHVLSGHHDYLRFVAYSPDGSRLATAGDDGSVRIWDPARAQQLTILDHEDMVMHLAFSADGARLATASGDGRARIWDVESGQRLATLAGHEAALFRVTFSPDGAQLVTAGLQRSVKIWDVETEACRLTLPSDNEVGVFELVYTPDGARLVTAGSGTGVQVWDTVTGEEVAVFDEHEGAVSALAISADGTRVATGSLDHRVRIWDLPTGELVATIEGYEDRVSDLAYSPDGTRLTSVSWDATGRVHDAQTGKLVAALVGGHGYGVVSLAYAPGAEHVATSSFDGSVVIWDPETGQRKAQLQGHNGDVWSLAFAPDGRQLATASVDHSARLWDLADVEVAVLAGPEVDVRRFEYSPDHTRLATLSTDGQLRLWTGETGEHVFTLDHDGAGGTGDGPLDIAYAPDGSQLASISERQLRIWDPQTGALRSTTKLADGGSNLHVSYAPAGTLLVVTSSDDFRVYDARTLAPLAAIVPDARPGFWTFSPDDASLGAVVSESTIQQWDPRTGARTTALEIPEELIQQFQYSPDSKELTTRSRSEGIRVWDARSLAPRMTLPRSRGLASFTYTPDGDRIAAMRLSGSLQVWDVETGEPVMEIEPDVHVSGANHASCSSEGSRIAIRGNSVVRTYDRETGEPLAFIDGHRSHIRRSVFWPNGTRMTTLYADNTLEVWDTETGQPLTRERVGVVREDGSIDWPIPPRELTRIGCVRLRVFVDRYPADICDPLLGD